MPVLRRGGGVNVGELFAGIGGFGLAAHWNGWRVRWASEIDPYAVRVYRRHFPDVEQVGDITAWEPDPERHAVDLICGGFPCQPVSVAGKQLAQADERWLWPEFARVVRVLRPRYVVVENVPGLLTRGMGDVLGDLAGLGYDAEWQSIPAAAVGAPHLRWRVWIVAYPHDALRHGAERKAGRRHDVQAGRQAEPRHDGAPECVADADDGRRRGEREPEYRDEQGAPGPASEVWSGRDAPTRAGWWDVEPPVGRVVDGLPDRIHRLRCLGNAIVPQIAAWIFAQIEERERAVA